MKPHGEQCWRSGTTGQQQAAVLPQHCRAPRLKKNINTFDSVMHTFKTPASAHPPPGALGHQRVHLEAGVGEVGARVVAPDGDHGSVVGTCRLRWGQGGAGMKGAGWAQQCTRLQGAPSVWNDTCHVMSTGWMLR